MSDIHELLDQVKGLAVSNERVIVGIAGPPASGKSTFVAQLADQLDGAVVVPMDGFHLDNVILERRGLLPRKGSPETFDASAYAHLLQRIKRGDDTIYAPLFDRKADLSRASAIEIPPETKVILAEGNYLLLDQAPWQQLQPLFDLTVSLCVPEEILQQRLLQRWLDHGLTEEAALARAELNDLPNARLVINKSIHADCLINNY
ncbi:nucleoside triphosphate hydrolase [Leucothrix pacifica]|uniref:Nucleoside/nucleotide kinase family protein n=1 Tax=Leucothrix pacifica TaxID=1247513 RepID=A0A317CMT6_9GAMM|nr:nucleoside triphosphate hydrolase [Leucothrix pacifica]PWQ97622.1 hypothetical protein DKW60_09585 [Leucothrix pacifica]